MPFKHLTRTEHEEHLHISHLYGYVSAWVRTPEEVEDLAERIEEALAAAKRTKQTQIVTKDGECCFHVTPSGYIILMLPWKCYKVAT